MTMDLKLCIIRKTFMEINMSEEGSPELRLNIKKHRNGADHYG